MNALIQWLDDRTGIKDFTHEMLYERIPGGARWRYVWGSTLVFAFAVQAITGIFLWMAYSPSSQTAWESVYYIQHEMYGGWLLRGIHHFMAQAMVVLLALHLMQVVIDGAYRAPREVNFWMGIILLKITLGLSLTGYLLPWDQKGYWATRVATNLAAIIPFVGPAIQKVVVGGMDYGHHTLTRFFALHAGVLPALLVAMLVPHIALFRRHGIKAHLPSKKADCYFWPDQVLKDAVACLAVLCFVLFFVFKPVLMGETISGHPGDILGAHLDAPADRANEYSAARPEWYFLFLFQFLKYFEGMGAAGELIGAIVAPGAAIFVLMLMPILGRWKLGHRFNVGFTFVLLAGAGLLTAQALWDDNMSVWGKQPSANDEHAMQKYKASQDFVVAVKSAEENAHRALELARAPEGIPPAGMLSVLARDPKTQGPRLFARYCASCHTHYDPSTSQGINPWTNKDDTEWMIAVKKDDFSPKGAPNLFRFASREWIAGVLDHTKILTPDYFGNTKYGKHKVKGEEKIGDMASFVLDTLKDASKEDRELAVLALSAEAKLPAQQAIDARDAAKIEQGKQKINALGCLDCHKFHDQGDLGAAPDLTGYGSAAWLKGMIGNPAHEAFYRDSNDRMPAFVTSDKDENNTLSAANLELLVRWLRGDWYESSAAGH